MIAKTTLKSLPYKMYTAILLKDESKIEKANELKIDGYYLITKSPKMVILFIEYFEGKEYDKMHKNVWKLL